MPTLVDPSALTAPSCAMARCKNGGGEVFKVPSHQTRVGFTRNYSALIPAARITLAHFSVNSTMNLPNSAGELANGTPPRSTSRAVNFGSARAALTCDRLHPPFTSGRVTTRREQVRGAIARHRKRRKRGLFVRPIIVTKAQLDQLEERGCLNPGDRGTRTYECEAIASFLTGFKLTAVPY